MPFAIRDGVGLYWRSNGHTSAAPLLLINSIGTDMGMWDGAVSWLETNFYVIRMDARGHGASDVPAGDYTIDMLALDALAVLDAAGVDRAHLCGLSMGGMVALHLGLGAPDRVNRVVVASSSAKMPADPWKDRAALVRNKGMAAIADLVKTRFFAADFAAKDTPSLANVMSHLLQLDPQGYAASCVAIAGLDIFTRLPELRAPLLVINGENDVATPGPEHGDRIAGQVAGATTATLPSGHMSAVEMPREFAEIVSDFLRK